MLNIQAQSLPRHVSSPQPGDHEEVGRMKNAERFAAFGMVVEFDCRRLIESDAKRPLPIDLADYRFKVTSNESQ